MNKNHGSNFFVSTDNGKYYVVQKNIEVICLQEMESIMQYQKSWKQFSLQIMEINMRYQKSCKLIISRKSVIMDKSQ